MRAWKLLAITGIMIIAVALIVRAQKDQQSVVFLRFDNGQGLYEKCKYSGEEYFPEASSSEDRLIIENKIGYCAGYIIGIAESIDLRWWSPPVPAQQRQIIAVVKKYLRDHPEQWNKSASNLVQNSLIEAFPPKQNK
jgi:hypothetical protein